MPLKEKYELELTPLVIGGKKLEVYTVKKWDTFSADFELNEDALITRLPFWVKIWEASIVLADHLVQIDLGKEAQILEIGAGMGITGLFLGAFGYKVTVTDREEDALELLQMNVRQNGLNTVSVSRLDWNNPDLTQKYDIICGSELIYKESSIGPVMNLFQKYLLPRGMVFIAHERSRMCMIKFIGMVPGRFEITNTSKTLRGQDKLYKVMIHQLRLT